MSGISILPRPQTAQAPRRLPKPKPFRLMTPTRLLLSDEEAALLGGEAGPARQLAMRIVVRMGEILGARRLVEIASAHIDGCLYHGDGGTEFAERLVELGGKTAVPATLNVGALDLLNPERVRSTGRRREMALRQMKAYQALGCSPTWTCAPYQSGHRPAAGEHVAWGESNAVAFANSVLGARTNRYGDFMDICCAIAGRAPRTGLHLDENRRATVVVDVNGANSALKERDVFYPVLGAWLGSAVGDRVAAITGLPQTVTEDQLKALGAAAASSGTVGLFHIEGVTPEAPDLATALGGARAESVVTPEPAELRDVRDVLSTAASGPIDAVAVGSPHFSAAEFAQLEPLLPSRPFAKPFYVCTGRAEYRRLERENRLERFRSAGVAIVVDTCVVVTPVLPPTGGVLMTNSGKFAHYTPSNTGYGVVYGSLEDCVASAARGRVVRDESLWS